MNKLIFNDSFNYGLVDELMLATIADDPDVMRKCASSAVVDEWGKIDPIKNHTVIHLIALGAFEKTGSNRNGDAFREEVCRKMHDSFKKHGALYRNHKSDDFNARNGDVIRTAFNEDMGRVELAVACDNDKCAHFLPRIEKGEAVPFSMGFKCAHDECSKCSHKAKTREEYCQHVHKKASAPYGMGRVLADGSKCFVFNPEGYFNDISDVPIGADQIAMDLRKVAALTDGTSEVIGGAELAEKYFISQDSVDHGKVAMARKAAEIEKTVSMMGQGFTGRTSRKRTLSKVASDTLRAAPPREMFLELAKLGAVLPLTDFYQLILGNEYHSLEPIIFKSAAQVPGAFIKLAGDSQRMTSVCSNTTYDPSSISHLRLDQASRREIAAEYSLSMAADRALKHAALSEPGPAIAASPTSQSDYLLDQYLSYKLSALQAISPDGDSNLLLASFL